jgi:hypothetical protein
MNRIIRTGKNAHLMGGREALPVFIVADTTVGMEGSDVSLSELRKFLVMIHDEGGNDRQYHLNRLSEGARAWRSAVP